MAYKKSKFQQRAKETAAKQAKQRAAREAKEVRRTAAVPLTKFEAAAGGSKKLAQKLKSGGAYKSVSAAQNAIRSGKLNESAYKLLSGRRPDITEEALAKYEEKKAAKQEAAKRATKQRLGLAPSKKSMLAAIDPNDPRNAWAADAIRKARVGAVSDQGIMRFGSRTDGDYIRLYGITRNYHKGDEPETFVVNFPLYGEVEGKRRETFPGFSKMTLEQQAALLSDHYYKWTRGNGELGAFQYMTKGEYQTDKKKRERNG